MKKRGARIADKGDPRRVIRQHVVTQFILNSAIWPSVSVGASGTMYSNSLPNKAAACTIPLRLVMISQTRLPGSKAIHSLRGFNSYWIFPFIGSVPPGSPSGPGP